MNGDRFRAFRGSGNFPYTYPRVERLAKGRNPRNLIINNAEFAGKKVRYDE